MSNKKSNESLSNAKKREMLADVIINDFVIHEGIKIEFKNIRKYPLLIELRLLRIIKDILVNYDQVGSFLDLPIAKHVRVKQLTVSFKNYNNPSLPALCSISINDSKIPVLINSTASFDKIEPDFLLMNICLFVFSHLGLMNATLLDAMAVVISSELAKIDQENVEMKSKKVGKSVNTFKIAADVKEYEIDNFKVNASDIYGIIGKLNFNPILALVAMLENYKLVYPTVKFNGNFTFINVITNLVVENSSDKSPLTRLIWKDNLSNINEYVDLSIDNIEYLDVDISEFLTSFGLWQIKDNDGISILHDINRFEVIDYTVDETLKEYINGVIDLHKKIELLR